jgi:hypothetical protein
METIQIELTSACVLKCSNCTRFCGTHRVPFFIEADQFHAAIDSLVGFAERTRGIVGFMGGEPLLHPQFAEFCEYALSRIPRRKLGLWSTFPDSPNYKKYREIIVKTFGNILLNDHSRADILHAPVLMAAEDFFRETCPECAGTGNVGGMPPDDTGRTCANCGGKGTVTNEADLFGATERCWVQESWSAAINPKGAFFCEVAASLADLFDGPEGWKVEPGWWKRTTKDFAAQRDWACRKCGAALPLARSRNSQDERDDVSASNLIRLEEVKSRKVAKGDFVLHDRFQFDRRLVNHTYPNQTYKDMEYRQGIAARYDMYLTTNGGGYWEPHLKEDGGSTPHTTQPAGEGIYHF